MAKKWKQTEQQLTYWQHALNRVALFVAGALIVSFAIFGWKVLGIHSDLMMLVGSGGLLVIGRAVGHSFV